MLGIVIPVHNEEMLLADCLSSVFMAVTDPALQGEPVIVVTVLDRCSDQSGDIAHQWPVDCLTIDAGNVGRARAAGVAYLLDRNVRWIGCTDADSRVAPDWLSTQLALQADMVCGTVSISDWGEIPTSIQSQYMANYHDYPDHRHIHGANLGFCAAKYRKSGGFLPLSAHEDVALVQSFERIGAHIVWSNQPRVFTSARLTPRTKEGFGDFLRNMLKTTRITKKY